jgi:twitching motility protein PilT
MRSRLMSMRDIDFSYSARRGVSFRVNAFFQRGRLSAVMRMAPKYAPNIDDLGVPVELKQLLTLREGLIMVCGNAGSGKSHTMQAIVQYINDHFVQHIVTIENPIEHIFEDNKCIISQREIGKDTLSFVSGIHSAVREDPNVIIISEINDMETMEAVINLVETGHLVISSTLSRKVGQVMERMVGFFPHTQKEQIQNRLSECMLAVLTQDLCERIDRPGRIAVYEFMINSPSVHQIIRHHKIDQVNTAIQSGAMEGMITMDAYAQQLAEQGIIAPETVDLFREHKF